MNIVHYFKQKIIYPASKGKKGEEMKPVIKDVQIEKTNIINIEKELPKTFLTLKFEFYNPSTSLTDIHEFIKEVQELCDIKVPFV